MRFPADFRGHVAAGDGDVVNLRNPKGSMYKPYFEIAPEPGAGPEIFAGGLFTSANRSNLPVAPGGCGSQSGQ